ncbi:hypothetical protein Syun_006939 [Stephania yunnanensis]|uniref:Uncharacterized protein n=1 Tax=Stephania yunnanensis TaxID=152371 RepID=A0AAP0PY51_9MAGN
MQQRNTGVAERTPERYGPNPSLAPIQEDHPMEKGVDSTTGAVAAAVPIVDGDLEACLMGKLQKEFIKYDVPHFYGEHDPIKAEAWILYMEKRMRTLNIDEWTIVPLVTFLLEHKTHEWWMTIERTHGINMNWL